MAGKIAGLKADQAFIDHTYIHFSGFSDAQKTIWSDELCERFGLDMDKLPKIIDPSEVIGEVSESSAKEFGLAPGTLIAAGAGDTAANALGAGIVRPGMLFDVAGTAAVLAGCTDKFVADTKNRALLTMRSVIPGLWNPLAYIGGGGIALRWFRDQFFNTTRGKVIPTSEELYPANDLVSRKYRARLRRLVLFTPPWRPYLPFQPGNAWCLGGRIMVSFTSSFCTCNFGKCRI